MTRRTGVVAEFDGKVGLGSVIAGDGSDATRYPFHCTQIAGGSRTIEVGTPVSFVVLAGRGGRWEAADLQQVD